MASCTSFCKKLRQVSARNGKLPSHDVLRSLFVSQEEQDKGASLGKWCELVQRDYCPFCRLVASAVRESLDPAEKTVIQEDQEISIVLFLDESSLRLTFPNRLGTRLAFVAEAPEASSGGDAARLVTSSTIDVSLVKHWIQKCEREHQDCALTLIEDEPDTQHNKEKERRNRYLPDATDFHEEATSNFRLIDLERGCITPARLDCRYVTLSYVWGNLPMYRLQADNFGRLSTEGNFQKIRDSLPRTVNDAIDLTRTLGERYLWVDGLCLVQDSDDDVSLGVEMMNSIYRGSCFTIVAGSGSDASSGLPGIGEERETAEHQPVFSEVAPGLRMTIRHSIDWHVSRSTYKTRGWTLQEFVLPRRTVVFVNDQVFFRCRGANWSEDSWAESWTCETDPDDSNITRLPEAVEGFMPCSWAYLKLSEEYSRRRLRRDGDALRAFSGISRLLAAGMSTRLVEGLPGYFLDQFLLSISATGDLRRRHDFPSFSWAGWEGPIMWPRENFVWFDPVEGRSWSPSNILKYLRYQSLVSWNAVGTNALSEHLTYSPYKKPSPLLVLMREYPDVFPPGSKEPDCGWGGFLWSSGGGVHADLPHWGPLETLDGGMTEDDRQEQEMTSTLPQFSIKNLDLCNGEQEVKRIVKQIDDKYARLALYNWAACRATRVRRSAEDRSQFGPIPHTINQEVNQCSFRQPRRLDQEDPLKDKRAKQGIKSGTRATDTGHTELKIPKFPPYTVLHFATISVKLELGSPLEAKQQPPSIYSRVAGIPLFSNSKALVGSLHPDNFAMLDGPGSAVECLVVSRSNTPTVASALLNLPGCDAESQWDLLWALCVVWKDGIAERRGVVQMLVSALRGAVGSNAEVKDVLLG